MPEVVLHAERGGADQKIPGAIPAEKKPKDQRYDRSLSQVSNGSASGSRAMT